MIKNYTIHTIFLVLTIFVFSNVQAHESDSENPGSNDGHHNVLVGGPKIMFKEKSFDFGTITQGDAVEHEFVFFNAGDAELVIKEIETSCGCTAALVSADKLAPGEEGSLKITYESMARAGEVERDIFVSSNDPEKPEVTLKIYADVDASMHDSFKAGIGLFSEKCNSCHGEPAKGLVGEELYKAVCLFCHGYDGDDKTRSVTYEQMNGRVFKNTIVYGIPGTEMPGFGKEEEGPLSDEQIDSLVNYINIKKTAN